MAHKEDRKKQKKRRKEEKKNAERSRLLQKRAAAAKRRAKYPHIEYDTRGGDPEFVSIVKKLVASFDFTDSSICPPEIQRLYRLQKLMGYPRLSDMFQELSSELVKDPIAAKMKAVSMEHPLGDFLGQWLFDRLPAPCREQPLPFHYFCARPVDRAIVKSCV